MPPGGAPLRMKMWPYSTTNRQRGSFGDTEEHGKHGFPRVDPCNSVISVFFRVLCEKTERRFSRETPRHKESQDGF